MKILVTYAVESEFAPWRTLLAMRSLELPETSAHRAQIGSATIDFVATGIGMQNAERVAHSVLFSEYSFCIVSGFAGALRDTCKVGAVVVAEKVRQITRKSGPLVASSHLLAGAQQAGAMSIQSLVTSERLVSSAAQKGSLAPFGEAVDMESYAVLHVAEEKGTPALAIRVISDSYDQDLPAGIDTLLDPRGNVNVAGVVQYLAKHPLTLPALLRLGRDSKTAATALANFLHAFINKLSLSAPACPPSQVQEAVAP